MVLGCIIGELLVPMTTQACDFQEGFVLLARLMLNS